MAVVNAFPSPHDIRFRDAKDLRDAVTKAPEDVVEAAKTIGAQPETLPAPDVLKVLTQAADNGYRRSISPPKTAAQGEVGPSIVAPQAPTAKDESAAPKPAAGPQRWALDANTGAMREAKNGEWVRWADMEAALAGKARK
jgi:hypothetical protein